MHAELEAILSQEQMIKLREIRADRGPHSRGHGPRSSRRNLKEQLDLTPEQETQVQEILANARKEMELSREANHALVIRQLKEVLSEEQIAKFESLPEHFPFRQGRGYRENKRNF